MRFYRLDATDTIVAIDPGWDAFARDNGGTGALAERILGQSLWESVSGSETTATLQRLLHNTRRSGTPWGMRYRCDSSRQERLFQLTATPEPLNRVQVRHDLLRSRPRLRDVVKDMSHAPRLWRCSQCLSYSATAHWFDHVHIERPQPAQDVVDCVCKDCRTTIQPAWTAVQSQSIA